MRQLRLLLLMLVACVAQVSHGQDLTQKWAEAAELEKNVTTALLYAQDDQDASMRIERIVKARYMTHDESISHVYKYISKIKDKLPKLDDKLSKGKKIDADDALKAAVCYSSSYAKLQDYAKAAKYFEVAAEGEKDDTLKAVLRLSAVGCKYQADKDKTAAAAAINFDIPAGCEPAMICIARKYDMHDIASEKLQQVFNVNKRQITRAIRSNNIEELKKYEIYDIPEVDSVLAINSRDLKKDERESLLRKCMLKHNMAWPLLYLNIENELFSGNLPEYVYKCAFYMPVNKDHNFQTLEKCWQYDLLRVIYETCQYQSLFIKKCGFGECPDANVFSNVFSFLLLDKLDKYNRRSDAACFSMAILAQFFGTSASEHLPKDVMYDLYDYTASLIKDNARQDPASFLDGANKTFAEYFTLGADGMAKFKAIDLKTEEGINKAVNMYKLFARFIANNEVGKYEPATFAGGNRNFLQSLAYKLQDIEGTRLNTLGLTIGFVIDKEGNVIDIKQMDDNLTKQEIEKVISAIKPLPKWKPATRNGQPIRESKIISIAHNSIKFLQ